MKWINRHDLSKLPTEGYCDVMVNLMTPIGLETTVMTYFAPSGPDKKFPDDGGFTRNNPQHWDDHFTHYCFKPEPFDGNKSRKEKLEEVMNMSDEDIIEFYKNEMEIQIKIVFAMAKKHKAMLEDCWNAAMDYTTIPGADDFNKFIKNKKL